MVTYTGSIESKEMAEIMELIYKLLRQHGADRLLIDARKSDVFLKFREALDFASDHPPEFKKVRTAVIENKEKEAQYTLYEMFVRNRGLNLKFFTSPKEAELWVND